MERLQSGGRPENKRNNIIENFNLNRSIDVMFDENSSSQNGQHVKSMFNKNNNNLDDDGYKVEAINGNFGKINNQFKNSTKGSLQMCSLDNIGSFEGSGSSLGGVKFNNKMDLLNDRELFNHFSNGEEQLDLTNSKPDEFNMGMPMHNGQIMNNKKNLINNPHIQESNSKNNFMAKNTINGNDSNDMYAELESELNNNKSNTLLNKESNSKDMKTPIDNIERSITIFEYKYSKEKNKEFTVDLSSPFGLSYIWKSLILLTKNPSTDKVMKMLEVNKKDDILNDMKIYSEIIGDMCLIEYIVPLRGKVINSNFTNKIEEIYNIKITGVENDNFNNAVINFNLKFELKIPFYYQPSIVNDFLLDYKNNKIKYIKLLNVPCSLDIDRNNNVVILEIPMGDNMILGFMYNLDRTNIENYNILYDKIIQVRQFDKIVKELTIPKINRTKKTNYGKKFNNEYQILKQLHLGEIVYGNMYDMDIFCSMELDIVSDKEVSKNKYEIKSTIDEIKINHRCYFYIKNANIMNKILISGLINY